MEPSLPSEADNKVQKENPEVEGESRTGSFTNSSGCGEEETGAAPEVFLGDHKDNQGVNDSDDDDGDELSSTKSFKNPDEARDEIKEVQKMTLKETRRIRCFRFLVVLLICFIGSGVAHMTHTIYESEEVEDTKDAFDYFTVSIQDLTRLRVENVFHGLRALSETISAYAAWQEKETWPRVSLRTFEVEAGHLRRLAPLESLFFLPQVELEERQAYEVYTKEEQGWIEISREIAMERHRGDGSSSSEAYDASSASSPSATETVQNTDEDKDAVQYQNKQISGHILASCETGVCASPYYNNTDHVYMPLWQLSPPPIDPSLIGLDLNHDGEFRALLNAMAVSRDVVLGMVQDTSVLTGISIPGTSHKETFHDPYVLGNEQAGVGQQRPHLIVSAPIFRVLGNRNSGIVGVVASVLPLDAFMANLLPDDIHGIDLVVRSTCGQGYTYQVVEDKAIYVGPGDFHDAAHDGDKMEIDFHSYLDADLSTSTPGHCVYTFSIYPTDTFSDLFLNEIKNGAVLAVAISFFAIAVVFFFYDRYSHQRNNKVVDAAARSHAIVTSLFPSNVRDQLMEEANVQPKNESKSGTHNNSSSAQALLRSFIYNTNHNSDKVVDTSKRLPVRSSGSGGVLCDEEYDVDKLVLPGNPLADLFPESTILFADIAGFTAWSSQRQPSQVFTLLETVYRAFDKSAKKRGVFKVETIGDCYVAVTGIPEPRADHAVAMCRFADDCRERMHVLSHVLQGTLGADTGDLSLRCGIHSGPCTAGVLRGDKSRFQLFGDTMNTASRIESTGKRDRIQLSQETADLLILSGKSDWITPRQDKIHAKGKGELQTYWLVKTTSSKSRSAYSGTELSMSGDDLAVIVPATTTTTAPTVSSSSNGSDKILPMHLLEPDTVDATEP